MPRVLIVNTPLGFTITKSEHQGYEEEYNEDWVDMRLIKRR